MTVILNALLHKTQDDECFNNFILFFIYIYIYRSVQPRFKPFHESSKNWPVHSYAVGRFALHSNNQIINQLANQNTSNQSYKQNMMLGWEEKKKTWSLCFHTLFPVLYKRTVKFYLHRQVKYDGLMTHSNGKDW